MDSDTDSVTDLAPVAWRPLIVIVAVVAVTHGVIATRYGWHRDEFYYVAAGRRLAWGYPDQPPLTPLLARAAAAIAAGVWPLRVVVVVFQCGTIALAALIARELNGRRLAQTLAAGCIAACPIFVGAALFLGTTPTDQFMWALIIWCVIAAVRTRRTGRWLLAGIAAGVGLENKHTVAILLVGILVGLAARRREILRSVGPWIASGIALVLWLPNLVWDANHHWESLSMARVLSDNQGGTLGAIEQLPLLLLVYPGPLILFIVIRGVTSVRRNHDSHEHSWLVIAAAVAVVAVTLAGGKPYYPIPLLVPLFALGAVASERRHPDRRGLSSRTTILVMLSAVISAVIGLPYLPPAFATKIRPLSQEPMETYGWPAFARQVALAEQSHPQVTAIYVSNYGEAGALTTFGHDAGLALPVVIGQNAYRDWGPPAGTPSDVLAVGEFDRSFLLMSWTSVQLIAPVTLPNDLKNEETNNDAAIYICTGPKGTWSELWPNLSYLS